MEDGLALDVRSTSPNPHSFPLYGARPPSPRLFLGLLRTFPSPQLCCSTESLSYYYFLLDLFLCSTQFCNCLMFFVNCFIVFSPPFSFFSLLFQTNLHSTGLLFSPSFVTFFSHSPVLPIQERQPTILLPETPSPRKNSYRHAFGCPEYSLRTAFSFWVSHIYRFTPFRQQEQTQQTPLASFLREVTFMSHTHLRAILPLEPIEEELQLAPGPPQRALQQQRRAE